MLVADANMEFVFKSVLSRPHSLGIRNISYDIRRHPRNDPGVFRHASDYLRAFIGSYDYVVTCFDYEGSGCHGSPSEAIREAEQLLISNGWRDRQIVLCLAPELEIWAWVDSIHVPRILGYSGSYSEMRDELVERGYWDEDKQKPVRPKEALEYLLKRSKIPRSSSLYADIASCVTMQTCRDTMFHKFTSTMKHWFPEMLGL